MGTTVVGICRNNVKYEDTNSAFISKVVKNIQSVDSGFALLLVSEY